MTTHDLAALNAVAPDVFAETIGDVFENAPWVAAGAATQRPFATVAALHDGMMETVRRAPPDVRLAFLRGHPELAGKVARAGAMTADSIAEQGVLGLNRLSDAEFDRFEALNTGYRARFAMRAGDSGTHRLGVFFMTEDGRSRRLRVETFRWTP